MVASDATPVAAKEAGTDIRSGLIRRAGEDIARSIEPKSAPGDGELERIEGDAYFPLLLCTGIQSSGKSVSIVRSETPDLKEFRIDCSRLRNKCGGLSPLLQWQLS